MQFAKWKQISAFVSIGIMLVGCNSLGRNPPGKRGDDTPPENPTRCHPKIVDLDVSPNRLLSGQRISEFFVAVDAGAKADCDVVIRIVDDDNETAALWATNQLKSGAHRYTLKPMHDYQFEKRDHCFTVTLDVAGTKTHKDATHKECARRTGLFWTLN